MLEEMKLHKLVGKIQECLELVPSDVTITPMITDCVPMQTETMADVSGSALKPLKTAEDLAMDVKGT